MSVWPRVWLYGSASHTDELVEGNEHAVTCSVDISLPVAYSLSELRELSSIYYNVMHGSDVSVVLTCSSMFKAPEI